MPKKRKRTTTAPSVALLAALTASLGACDADPGNNVQRDVYSGPNALENCIADWGNPELCQSRLNDAEKQKLAAQGGGAGAHSVFIWGPGYVGDRSVSHGGTTYTPSGTKATSTANFNRNYQPTNFTAPRPATPVGSAPSSRGGFGAAGRSVGGGSVAS